MTDAAYAREYMRKRRATLPDQRAKDKWWVNTRDAAIEQLAREYPERFAEILAKIRADNPGPWWERDA
jgi:hypothetical protein